MNGDSYECALCILCEHDPLEVKYKCPIGVAQRHNYIMTLKTV